MSDEESGVAGDHLNTIYVKNEVIDNMQQSSAMKGNYWGLQEVQAHVNLSNTSCCHGVATKGVASGGLAPVKREVDDGEGNESTSNSSCAHLISASNVGLAGQSTDENCSSGAYEAPNVEHGASQLTEFPRPIRAQDETHSAMTPLEVGHVKIEASCSEPQPTRVNDPLDLQRSLQAGLLMDTSREVNLTTCDVPSIKSEDTYNYIEDNAASNPTSTGDEFSATPPEKTELLTCDVAPETIRSQELGISKFIDHNSKKLFKCDVCTYTNVKRMPVRRHLMSKHGIGEPFQCELCDYTCTRHDHMRQHRATSHGVGEMHRCELCSYSTARKTHLKQHFAAKHGTVKPFECVLCDYCSAWKNSLKQHIIAIHGAVKSLKCDMCDYSCTEITSMKRHKAGIHGQGETYKCELCDYSNVQKTHLKRHQAAIHGMGEFRCDACSYSCAYRSRLREHAAIKHGAETPYKCELCGYTFARRCHLKKHQVSVHGL